MKLPNAQLAIVEEQVHVHEGRAGYEVEFMTLAGETLAVVTLRPAQVRPIQPRDVAHVREMTSIESA